MKQALQQSVKAIAASAFALFAFSSLSAQSTLGDVKVPVLTSVDIGKPKGGNTTIINDGKGIKIQGYGTMFGMHLKSDQGRFAYKKIKGDFDIIIQVENITSSTEGYAEGGLMVRKDLNPEGLFVANFVTNNNYKGESDLYTFMFRTKKAGSIEPYWDMAIDSFYGYHTIGNPAFGYSARGWNKTNTPTRPYPYVWLRIIRQGNTYKGYRRSGSASDWGKWEQMTEITFDLGEEPLVGLALSANHHHPTIYGKVGDPESMSELTISGMIGFK